ncbi:MAG: hypothetical protein ACD_9C00047G0007 [uncultured bacterium]|nr:MAG: hypothetical protein ACD_9C00047G0007 [uncultured bacterium]
MGKYFTVAINSIKKNLVYRMNNFITAISVFLSFIMLFYFWNSIYMQGNKIGSYSLNEMISYYVFMTIFQLLVIGDNTAWSIGEEIRNGQITNSILKPINYLRYKLSQSFGNLAYRIVIFLPVSLIAIFALKSYLTHAQNFETYVFFSLLSLVSYILFFLLYFVVGVIAFWTVESNNLFWTCWVIINFMQGGLIPLDLLPKWFLMLSEYLPFKYLFFVPIGLITGRLQFDYTMILIPLLWCVGIYLFAQFLYLKGMKKYEGFGI